jgi:hypothetical protein
VAAWFKQAIDRRTLITGTLSRVKALHIATALGTDISKLLIAGLMVSSGGTAFSTKLYQIKE